MLYKYDATNLNRLQAEYYLYYYGDNNYLRQTLFYTDTDFKQKQLETVLSPTNLYFRGDYTRKESSVEDSQTIQKILQINRNGLTFTYGSNTYTVTPTKIEKWDTVTDKVTPAVSIYATSQTGVSIGADSYVAYTHHKTLSPGTWIVHGAARFPANSNGHRGLGLSTSNSTSSGNIYDYSLWSSGAAFSTGRLYLQVNGLVKINSNTPLYLKAYSSVGTTVDFYCFNATRLCTN